MTPHDGAPAGPGATRWLDEEEMAAWLPLLRVGRQSSRAKRTCGHCAAQATSARCPSLISRHGLLGESTPDGVEGHDGVRALV